MTGQDEYSERGALPGIHDPHLTKQGRAQAGRVAAKLNREKIDIVWTSPLRRAKETADIVAKQIGVGKFHGQWELNARNLGILNGELAWKIPKLVDPSNLLRLNRNHYIIEVEGGESLPALWQRAGTVVEAVKHRFASQNVLLVTHQEVAVMIRAAILNLPWQEGVYFYPPNTSALEFEL